jgi:hypothetical protein
MLYLSPNVNLTKREKQRKQTSFQGTPLRELQVTEKLLKKTPVMNYISLLTAMVSSIGFGVGGTGLMYDHFAKKGKKENKNAHHNRFNDEVYKAFVKLNDALDKIEGNHHEGVKDIEPETPFGKLGMKFAKIGIAFSGIAGFFNGISMKLPLMSFGEGMNVVASPIINKPEGLGIFSIGLATVFASRALENDPQLKLNENVLKTKQGILAKAGYVAENMLGSVKEVGKSAKVVISNIGKLFTSERAVAADFFKWEMFAVKPSKMMVYESISDKGISYLKTSMKSSPYLMHTASAILAVGGVLLTVGSLFKQPKVQKTGLITSEVGGSLDNLSLSKWGLEKYALADSASAKTAGALLAASGVTILSGQPNVEKDYGRALQWLGCALLFAVFVVERKHELGNAIKSLGKMKKTGLKTENTGIIRQFEIDLQKMFKGMNTTQKNNVIKVLQDFDLGDMNKMPSLIAKIDNPELQRNVQESIDSGASERLEKLLNEMLKNLKDTKSAKALIDEQAELAENIIGLNKKLQAIKSNPELKQIMEAFTAKHGQAYAIDNNTVARTLQNAMPEGIKSEITGHTGDLQKIKDEVASMNKKEFVQ